MRSRTSLAPRQPIFYGWVIVGTVFIILMVTSGLGFYNASVILSAAVKELDAEVGVVSGATGLFFVVAGLTSTALSKLMDTVDLRWFFAASGVIGSVALFSLRWVDSVPLLYAFFAVFGIAFALSGLVPSTTLVARWFDRRRAIALSIASTGLSMGGILITPFAARSITDVGLAASGQWMAVLWLIGVIPLATLFLRSQPADKGLQPDGAPAPRTPVALPGASFAEAIRTRFFRWLCLTYSMIFLAQVGAIAHLFNLIQDRQGADTAAYTLSALALTSVVGRLAGGALVLRVGTRTMTIALTVLQGGSLIVLATANTGPLLLAGTILFGLSVGNLLMLQPLLLAEAFGVKAYSRIYSVSQLFGTIGVGGGPLLLGLLHDSFDYRVAFFVAAGANVVGFFALMAAGGTEAPKALWKAVAVPPEQPLVTTEPVPAR